MEHIGTRIKALRRQRDMTQEKLAEYLNVSFQAVSKWETGAASPDLAMIAPLTRVLGTTADELLGIVPSDSDSRRTELETQLQATYEDGDTAARLSLAEAAVREYPGDLELLLQLADAEQSYAIHNAPRGSAEMRDYFARAARHYETVFEDSTEDSLRHAAIWGIVLVYPQLGRRAEAAAYAAQHPDEDELLLWCLEGEALTRHRQSMIMHRLALLIGDLEWDKYDLPALQTAEGLVKLIISDGNYLWYYDMLMHNAVWQAMALTRAGRPEEAIASLRRSRQYAIACEEVVAAAKIAPQPYTAPLLDRLSFDAKSLRRSGMTTLVEDWAEYLTWSAFDRLRAHPDFAALTAEA